MLNLPMKTLNSTTELPVMIPPPESEASRMFAMIERMATDPQVDPAKLREILSVKQAWEADESRKAFAAAMAQFQSKCPIIEKLDTANGRGYARLDRIHREIRPLLRECGLWFSWTVCEEREGGLMHLEGILGHSSGHQVPCRQLISLPDKISGTNAAQRAGSGQTYAKRYGELAALNVVTGDDDDGNAKPHQKLPPVQDQKIAELKRQLWEMTKSVHGGNKNVLRQFLTDDCGLDPDKTLEDLSSKELEALIFTTKTKI